MNILFLHPNFPAQFWHLSKALAMMGDKVVYLTTSTNGNRIGGVTAALYKRARAVTKGIHPYRRRKRSLMARRLRKRS